MKKFATCLNCVDGRVQLPVIQWIKKNYAVDYVDMITEAGMDGFIADKNSDIQRISRTVDVSLKRSKTNTIFIAGHCECLGNPVDDETHKRQICMAAQRLKELRPACQVKGLWISNEWLVEQIVEL